MVGEAPVLRATVVKRRLAGRLGKHAVDTAGAPHDQQQPCQRKGVGRTKEMRKKLHRMTYGLGFRYLLNAALSELGSGFGIEVEIAT